MIVVIKSEYDIRYPVRLPERVELYKIQLKNWHIFIFFFFQAEDCIRDLVRSRGLGDVYKSPLHAGFCEDRRYNVD